MSWTEVRCKNVNCSATFKAADGVDMRDCQACDTTHRAPWDRYAVRTSSSIDAQKARERRKAVAGEPTTVSVEITGVQASHIARAAEAAGTSPDEFVSESAVSRATDELQLSDPTTGLEMHRAAVYDALEDHGRLAPHELYQEYTRRVDAPRTKDTVRGYLSEMIDQGRVRGYGHGPARRYSFIG